MYKVDLRRNRDTLEHLRRCQIDLKEAKLHVVMHDILSVPEVLGVNDILPGVGHANFNHVYELQLRSNGDFFVTPKADL